MYPDILLILALYAGLRWGRVKGAQFGGLVGFLQDLTSYGSMGFNLFSKSVIGFSVGLLKERYVNDSLYARIALVLAASVFDFILYNIFTRALYGHSLDSNTLASLTASQASLNLLALFIIIPSIEALECIFLGPSSENRF
jgi:rod shape-determining protein MreD